MIGISLHSIFNLDFAQRPNFFGSLVVFLGLTDATDFFYLIYVDSCTKRNSLYTWNLTNKDSVSGSESVLEIT